MLFSTRRGIRDKRGDESKRKLIRPAYIDWVGDRIVRGKQGFMETMESDVVTSGSLNVERLVGRVVQGKGSRESWKNVRKRRTAPFFHPLSVHDLRPVLSLRSFFPGRGKGKETVVR